MRGLQPHGGRVHVSGLQSVLGVQCSARALHSAASAEPVAMPDLTPSQENAAAAAAIDSELEQFLDAEEQAMGDPNIARVPNLALAR